jgi:hypothetical protein
MRVVGANLTNDTTQNQATIAATGVAIAANAARSKVIIQNCGTVAAKLNYGSTAASATVFCKVLKPGSANDDGLGETWVETDFKGDITLYAASACRVVVTEFLS